MMLKWLLGTILGILIGLAVYFCAYLGVFKPVDLVEKQVGPIQLLYKVHVGPYHKIVSTLDEVEKWAHENQVPCKQTFGQFLDNANTVEEGRLRANCGCVMSFGDKAAGLNEKIPENLSEKLPPELKLLSIPRQKYVTVTFEGSPGIGPMRVYPKVNEYFAAKNIVMSGSVIESYRVISDKEMITTYLFPM